VGVRDPRLSAGFDWATRQDGTETGLNTVASPRAEVDSTRRLISGFAYIKPFQLLSDQSAFPLGLIGRWDRYKPSSGADGYINTVIGGLTLDLNKKSSLSLDYQEQTPKNGVIAATTKTYFLHMVANF
jgi:hypothetical protein